MKKILIFKIKIYQYFLSPLLGNKCRFLPTCSEYFIEAINTKGLIVGFKLGIKRIFRCHPIIFLGGGSGIDNVPATNNKDRKNG